jgi:hypothetical protein
MRTEEEIRQVFKEITNSPASEVMKKYKFSTLMEATGFLRALEWVLEIREIEE